jgi:ribosomal protein S18 acetylase RimI-like enzyme
MRPVIRPAREDDADFLAWAILAAQRGHVQRGWLDIALGLSETETLAFARRLTLTESRSWWHTSTFFIAEMDGTAAATLCSLPTNEAATVASEALQEVVSDMDLDPTTLGAIRQRGAYISECWMAGNPEAWLIEHVATRPAHRGRGIVPALLEHAIAIGKQKGHDEAQLTFLIGNVAAEKSYRKAGFRFAEEKRSAGFESVTGAPGLRRYERKI